MWRWGRRVGGGQLGGVGQELWQDAREMRSDSVDGMMLGLEWLGREEMWRGEARKEGKGSQELRYGGS